MNRPGIGFIALLWLLLFCSPGLSQEGGFKSIHAIESEAHRDMKINPDWGPAPATPLSPAAPSNLTRTVFGFYPYWATGYSQIRFQDLTHLAVFSVEADGNGQLVNLRGWPNIPLVSAAHQANVRVVLVCTLFSSGQVDQLLTSATARERLIANLREQVLLGGADGVNIDFEGVPANQKNNLVTFMRDLAAAMRAAVPGAHISIDTPAVDWSSGWDYPSLADICDALMVMAYDYYWSGSSNAGPVAPLSENAVWGKYNVRWTVADYLNKIGSARNGKVILGVPYYGYDWPAQSEALNAKALGSAQSKAYRIAAAEAEGFGRRWDDFSATPWYFYLSSTPHQVWYEDAASLTLKYDLVLQNGLQGIGIWALTYDGDRTELWKLLEDRFSAPSAPDPPEITAPAVFFDTVGLPVALRERGSVRANGFEVAVGTSAGGTEISGFMPVGLRRQVLIRGLTLASGATYYVMARSVNEAGIAGTPSAPVSVRIDASQLPNRKYLPRWISSNDFYTGLSLVNSESSTRAALFRGHIVGQGEAIFASWVLKPGEQLAQIVSQQDLFGQGVIGKEGWLEVLYPGDGLQGMYLVGDTRVSRLLAGSPLVDAASEQIVPLPDAGRAQIIVVNPGNEKAELEFRLGIYPGSGTPIDPPPKHITLAAGEQALLQASDLFPGPADLWQISNPSAPYISYPSFIKVKSDPTVLCTSWLQREGDAAAVPALSTLQALKSGAFSYFVTGGGYFSQAVIVNPTAELQIVELSLHDLGAGPQAILGVYPMSSTSVDIGGFLTSWKGTSTVPSFSGSLSIKVTSGSGVLGSIWIRSEDFRLMASLPLEPATSTSFRFPQLVQAQGYWTGLSVTRLGSHDATVEAFDAAGKSLGTAPIPFGTSNTWVGLIYQLIPATLGISSGRVEVRSTGFILAAEIFGSDTLSFMAAVPGR